MIRTLIADNHPLTRIGVHHLLAGTPGIDVVAEAEDAERACVLARQHRPDVVVLDADLRGQCHVTLVRALHALDARVVVHVGDAVRGLAPTENTDYVSKRKAKPDLPEAIRAVAAGHTPPPGSMPRLSEHEHDVLLALARGLDNAEIGAALKAPERAIADSLTHLNSRIGVETDHEAVVWATRHGFGEQTGWAMMQI